MSEKKQPTSEQMEELQGVPERESVLLSVEEENFRPATLIVPRAAKAYFNVEFLSSPEARPIRILAEYLYPLEHFRKAQVHNTIIFFGSSRIPSPEQYQSRLAALTAALQEVQDTEQRQHLESELQELERHKPFLRYYEDARRLATMLTQWSEQLPPKQRYYICSGGGPGIMEAANRGAFEAGGDSIGLNISIPFEQHPNPYITPHLNFEFHYFFMRKYWFVYFAKAMVVFPGGFGTMDELFEILTLLQTRKIKKPLLIVIYGEEFWRKVVNFEYLVEAKMISESDLELFVFCNDPEEAFQKIVSRLNEQMRQ